MDNFIDIHTHILPQIDDGAKSIEQSLSMLRIAKENHTSAVIATPHFVPGGRNISMDERKEVLERVRERIAQENLGIELYLGNEIYYRSVVPELLEEGKISTLADSSYVLVEFNPMQDFSYIRDGLYRLLSEGYRPILAHTERYVQIMKKRERIQELQAMGSYMQVNAESICGNMGYQIKKEIKWMLKNDYVQFIASDAHSDKRRIPNLWEAAKYIERKHGKDMVKKLFSTHPKQVIINEYI